MNKITLCLDGNIVNPMDVVIPAAVLRKVSRVIPCCVHFIDLVSKRDTITTNANHKWYTAALQA